MPDGRGPRVRPAVSDLFVSPQAESACFPLYFFRVWIINNEAIEEKLQRRRSFVNSLIARDADVIVEGIRCGRSYE